MRWWTRAIVASVALAAVVHAVPDAAGAGDRVAIDRSGRAEFLAAEIAGAGDVDPRGAARADYIDETAEICFSQTFRDGEPEAGETINVARYELDFDCASKSWYFGITTNETWTSTDLELLGLWVSADGRLDNGCVGFDQFLAGGYNATADRYYLEQWRTPSCDADQWEYLAPLSALDIVGDLGQAGLEFTNASIGNPSTFTWYAVVIPRDNHADFMPNSEQLYPWHVARGFRDGVAGGAVAAFVAGPTPTIGGSYDFSIGLDVNGDGPADVVYYEPGVGGDAIRLGTSAGGFRAGPPLTVNGSYDVVIPGDFNGDGFGDVLYHGEGTKSDVLRLGGANGGFRSGPATTINGSYDFVLPGDFNGDGVDDLVFYERGARGDVMRFGTRSGAFRSGPSIAINGSYRIVVPGDFNGDGRSDLLFYSAGVASDGLKLGTATGALRSGPLPVINGSYAWLIGGDFNGDARTDLLFYNPGETGDVVRYASSDATFRSGPIVRFDIDARPVAGDFNGDGRSDVLWYAPGSAFDSLSLGVKP